ERRLAYVAITRAKQKLFCTHVRERLLYGRTQYNAVSRFISEIPEENVDCDAVPKKNGDKPQESASSRRKPVISKEFFKKSELLNKAGQKANYERFSVGEAVEHATFGRGSVLSVKDMGGDTLYEIAFDSVGTKKLMATYAKLKKVQ
ncbi:MAG: ATP-dependent DNA helicase PcrA, partial [Eubacteriales bacterium]